MVSTLTVSKGIATLPRKSGALSPSSPKTVSIKTSWMSFIGLWKGKKNIHKNTYIKNITHGCFIGFWRKL